MPLVHVDENRLVNVRHQVAQASSAVDGAVNQIGDGQIANWIAVTIGVDKTLDLKGAFGTGNFKYTSCQSTVEGR